MKLIYIGGNEH